MRSGDPEEGERSEAGELRSSGGTGWELPPATVEQPPPDLGGIWADEQEPYRPIQPRARWAIGLLVAGIVADVAGVASGLMERSLLSDMASGQIVTDAEANANDLRQLIVGVVQGAVFVVTAVAFILWFSRVYRNLTALGADGLRYGYSWAVGAWFVPLFNLWRPKQIANDIWRASDPDLPAVRGSAWRALPAPALFLVWWIAYLALNVARSASVQESLGAETIGELRDANTFVLVADVVAVVAALLALLVVHLTSARQAARAEFLGLEPYREPAPLRRRGSAWAALAAVVAGISFQLVTTALAWNAPVGSDEEDVPPAAVGGPPAPLAPAGAPADALFADDFSRRGIWEEVDEPGVTMDYVNGRYRIAVAEPQSFWFSSQVLPAPVAGLSVEADALLFDGSAELDSYGVMCLHDSGSNYFFGVSPDGYYTIRFDPNPSDAEAEVERLVEETAVEPFAGEREFATLRAECVRGDDGTRVALAINGRVVAETVHPGGGEDFVGVALFVYSEEGGTAVRFDDVVVRELGSR